MNEKKSFTARDIEVLRSTPVADILLSLGCDTSCRKSGTHSKFYYSPFHSERTPSFHVDETSNRWFDHGNPTSDEKVGGDAIDLVMRLKKCDFVEACKFLSEYHPDIENDYKRIISAPKPPKQEGPSIIVSKSYVGIMSDILKDYAVNTRRISPQTLNRYCFQVHYHYRRSEERKDGKSPKVSDCFAIGFPNIRHQWSLRNNLKPLADGVSKNKISTGAAFSVISADGSFVYEESLKEKKTSDSVVVFEGFFDFLSWMDWTGRKVPGNCDVVVLNSTSNTASAVEYLSRHRTAYCYLDNDASGDEHTKYLIKNLVRTPDGDSITVHDLRTSLKESNDVNEAWVTRCEKLDLQKKTQPRSLPTAEQLTNHLRP